MAGDARSSWQQRDDNARAQETRLVTKVKEHNSEARQARMTGEIVHRTRYKDGGIIGMRTEVLIDEKMTTDRDSVGD